MKMKPLLPLLLSLGLCGGYPQPDREPASFRFAYVENPNAGEVAQFYTGADGNVVYSWGYQYPGQAHQELKTNDGVVQGSFSYRDPNGEVQLAQYRAQPDVGFKIEQQLSPAGSAFEAAAVQPMIYTAPKGQDEPQASVAADVQEMGYGLDTTTFQALEKASPTTAELFKKGYLQPITGQKSEFTFKVSKDVIDNAQGSVSAIAAKLGIYPPAARHDTQIYRKDEVMTYRAGETDVASVIPVLDTVVNSSGVIDFIVKLPKTQ